MKIVFITHLDPPYSCAKVYLNIVLILHTCSYVIQLTPQSKTPQSQTLQSQTLQIQTPQSHIGTILSEHRGVLYDRAESEQSFVMTSGIL